jgi:hypothetical protein
MVYMPGFPAHIDTVGQRMYSRFSVELLGTFLILHAVQVLVRHILFVCPTNTSEKIYIRRPGNKQILE